MALEMDPGARTFITLPVFPVDRLAAGGATTLDFAHFVNGDGATSDLVFVNPSTQPSRPGTPFISGIPPIRPAIYFYDTEGDPIAAESVVDVTGDLEIREDGGLTVRTEMEPLGELTISTHGRGALVSGSVKVVSDGPIGGMLRFDLPGIIGEAVVGPAHPSATPSSRCAAGREESPPGSPSTTWNRVRSWCAANCCRPPGLYYKRGRAARRSVSREPLAANGQTSWLIDAAFPAPPIRPTSWGRCAAMRLGEGLFSAVALEMDPGTRTFITLPVFPVEESTDQE